MARCCFYTAGTLSLLLLVTSVTLLVARVFQKAVDQTIEKVSQTVCMCVCVQATLPLRTSSGESCIGAEPAEHSSCLPLVSRGWQDVET